MSLSPCLVTGTIYDGQGNFDHAVPISATLTTKEERNSPLSLIGSDTFLSLLPLTVYTDRYGNFSLPLYPFLSLVPSSGYFILLPSFSFYAEIPSQETITLLALLQLRTTVILGPRQRVP